MNNIVEKVSTSVDNLIDDTVSSLRIRPKGFGIIFLYGICSTFLVVGLIVFVGSLTPSLDTTYVIIGIIAILIGLYGFLSFSYKGKVEFCNNKFHTFMVGNGFTALKQECREIVDYQLRHKNMVLAIEFTLASDKKKYWPCVQFTREQVIRVLQEIQSRGGLVNKNIELKNNAFRRKNKLSDSKSNSITAND